MQCERCGRWIIRHGEMVPGPPGCPSCDPEHDGLHPSRANEGEIHCWFGLTYASYLVLPRSLLQEMPTDWQAKFVGLLHEMEREFPGHDGKYEVHVRGESKRYESDPLSDYRRPDAAAIAKARLP